ncbi:uncharacterized protein [Anoplolepis gracilipes]|uniref:uncharacterized protein n=1 Tax=Anoplolepis gracilipes TaxID=354296 RepID=UPI003BA2220B
MSLVWKYFSKSEKNVAKCTLCSKKVKTSGTTSNLLAHLKTKHLFAFDECIKKKKNTCQIVVIKDKASKKNYRIISDSGYVMLRRRLHAANINSRPAARKIELKPAHREQRIQFARQHLNTPQEEWNAVVWMDEKVFSSAEEGRYKVWRPKGQRLNPKYVLPSGHSGKITIGFWGSMTSHGLLDLVEITPRMDAEEYVEILEEVLKPSIRRIFPEEQYPVVKIVQDNSAVHTSRLVQACEDGLKENLDQEEPSTNKRSRSQSPLSIDDSPHSSQNTLLEVFNRRTSFESGGSRNTVITKALVNMICKDNMPTRTVEREGFIHFVKTLCPLYKLPSRSTLTILLEEKYKVCRSQLKEMLNQVHYVSLTSDICTIMNSTRNFLVITGHFINAETCDLESVCLEAVPLTERHTANTISEQFYQICEEYSLSSLKIASITTDGAANMQKAVELFSDSSKWSTIASDGLRAEQLKHGKSEGNIIYLTQDISIRWNSTLEMVEKFEKLAPTLGTILASRNHKDSPQMLAGYHIEVVSEIIRLLAPFKEATTPLINMLLPASYCYCATMY